MKSIIPILLIALLAFGCTDTTQNTETQEGTDQTSTEAEQVSNEKKNDTKGQIATFLTFQENNAEEAMNFYVSLFDNSKVTEIERYGKDGPGKEGTLFFARFELNGSQFVCSDSYIKHQWTFTPGVSNWVDCQSSEEIENLFTKLSDGGKALMPLDNYGWSQQFAFVEDRFGVSWQLNLP